jgi:TonB family protein
MQPYAVAASVILLVTCTLAVWLTHFYWTKETPTPQLTQSTRPAAASPALQPAPPAEETLAPTPRTDIGLADPQVEKTKKPENGSATAETGLYSENSTIQSKAAEIPLPAQALDKEAYTASAEDKRMQGVPGVAPEPEAREDSVRLKQATQPVTARGISRVVRGKVTDAATGAPLPGVNVTIKGTDTRTLSDARGNFSVEVPAGSPTLVFNLIGMTTEEQDVRTADFLQVQLEPDAQSLNDVVVIGYGEAGKPAGNAGSVTPVGGLDEFNRYVKENLRRPDTTRREVVVNLECVVQADGTLSDFVIRKSAGQVYDREAIRVLKEGPRWQPARQRGKAVAKKVTLRIPFKP